MNDYFYVKRTGVLLCGQSEFLEGGGGLLERGAWYLALSVIRPLLFHS